MAVIWCSLWLAIRERRIKREVDPEATTKEWKGEAREDGENGPDGPLADIDA